MLNELLIKELSNKVDTNTSDIQNIKDGSIYSTSEVDTGIKWINGKTIYRKVIELPTITSTNQDVNINCNIDNLYQILDIRGIIYINNSSGDWGIPLNFYNQSSTNYSFLTFYKKTNSQLVIRNWNITKGGYAILYYTKTTD